jgi:hypothetical protein
LSDLASISFGPLYDAGDKPVHNDVIIFAGAKLLKTNPRNVKELTDDQKSASLSLRIHLEFDSTTYFAWENERKQVEGQMHVCLKINAAFESMVTVSTSEPFLSEAAYGIMARTLFNVPRY